MCPPNSYVEVLDSSVLIFAEGTYKEVIKCGHKIMFLRAFWRKEIVLQAREGSMETLATLVLPGYSRTECVTILAHL